MIRLSFPTKQKFNLTLQCKGQWKLIGYDENMLFVSRPHGNGTKTIHLKTNKDIDCRHDIKLLVEGQTIDINIAFKSIPMQMDKSLYKNVTPDSGALCIDNIMRSKYIFLEVLEKYQNDILIPIKDGNCLYIVDKDFDIPVFIAYTKNMGLTLYKIVTILLNAKNHENELRYKQMIIDLIDLF